MKPDAKVSVRGAMELMRDHFEGTPLDLSQGVGAGPFALPVLLAPDDVEGGRRRVPARARDPPPSRPASPSLPSRATGSRRRSAASLWFGVDDTYSTVYVPQYCGNRAVPRTFGVESGSFQEFRWDSAFWVFNFVSNWAYGRYSDMIQDVQKVQRELESGFLSRQAEVEKAALALHATSPGLARDYLTQYSVEQGDRTTARWRKLGESLIVKYLDGNVRDEHGKVEAPALPGELAAADRAGPGGEGADGEVPGGRRPTKRPPTASATPTGSPRPFIPELSDAASARGAKSKDDRAGGGAKSRDGPRTKAVATLRAARSLSPGPEVRAPSPPRGSRRLAGGTRAAGVERLPCDRLRRHAVDLVPEHRVPRLRELYGIWCVRPVSSATRRSVAPASRRSTVNASRARRAEATRAVNWRGSAGLLPYGVERAAVGRRRRRGRGTPSRSPLLERAAQRHERAIVARGGARPWCRDRADAAARRRAAVDVELAEPTAEPTTDGAPGRDGRPRAPPASPRRGSPVVVQQAPSGGPSIGCARRWLVPPDPPRRRRGSVVAQVFPDPHAPAWTRARVRSTGRPSARTRYRSSRSPAAVRGTSRISRVTERPGPPPSPRLHTLSPRGRPARPCPAFVVGSTRRGCDGEGCEAFPPR